MADCMMFPKDWHDFIKDYSFIDSERVYTNGSELIQVFRAIQLIEHLLIEQEEQIKNRDESLEKAREEIKWLRGMLKEHERRWIPVSERLPEDGERALAITKSGNQFVGFHTQFSGWHFEHVIHPTHWMPLPEPPQEG